MIYISIKPKDWKIIIVFSFSNYTINLICCIKGIYFLHIFLDKPMFECNDGEEIDASWKCDGTEDCSEGEDEQDCQDPPTGQT